MYYVADTARLQAEGVLTPAQVAVIRSQAREAMMRLAVGILLTGGILAATVGLIVWLAAPLPVAMIGAVFLAGGIAALWRGGETLRFFGNAAALIGAGLLLGGASVELIDKAEAVAGPALALVGAAVAGGFGAGYARGRPALRFACGAVFLMGAALHLAGVAMMTEQHGWSGAPMVLLSLYAAAVLAGAGALVDIRFVTALAIVPYAQALSTGTAYWHASYAFFSPEPTLSILQMSVLIAAGIWAARTLPERWGRHGGILAIMAAVVANLCALVGSLFGDWVGNTIWGPGQYWRNRGQWEDYDAWKDALDAWRETAMHIPEGAYSILWAVALAAAVVWAARGARRGLFNTAVTFAAIHAYTQAFESFGDQPLAYVIGGLVAIPLAWGLWRLDRRWIAARAA